MKARIAIVVAGALACGGAAQGGAVEAHRAFLPQNMQWEAAPSSLPGGAEMAVLYGDPSREGDFVVRIKAPKGYRVPPHTHPKAELVTIISGAFSFGRGQAADRATVEKLPAGSFISMPAGVLHYVFVDEDSVLQITATGPWQIDYYDPKDDPRLNIAPAGTVR
ncbi:cupin domain-containing protein [Methylocystis sp. L43]|jgi:quercetin dioxygenase-like cupin family protein|uniref:cupin domain-containing protein n=1 Tax=unclassified Methylocystis TaxID=2625913 RepID=UPI0018C2C340|nr:MULTISPECIES: cupin domain-containing protein [unclassified Methylocystis]MBG0799795.1 cupin domain-containing protein [Methylocystis sp. L43]MBG0807578.1 cupin domain-containing protein [Methylocystis sp. H15]